MDNLNATLRDDVFARAFNDPMARGGWTGLLVLLLTGCLQPLPTTWGEPCEEDANCDSGLECAETDQACLQPCASSDDCPSYRWGLFGAEDNFTCQSSGYCSTSTSIR